MADNALRGRVAAGLMRQMMQEQAMRQPDLEELYRVQQRILNDPEHQRSLGPAGRVDPNAMPFVRPDGLGFPAQVYQDYSKSGLPQQNAIDATRDDMENVAMVLGWGDRPDEAPSY
jgi:hypothetical protein